MIEQSKLPARAHGKLAAILDDEQSAFMIVNSTNSRISELHKAVRLGSEEGAVDLQAEIERLTPIIATQQRRHQERSMLAARVRQFMMALPADTELDDAKRSKPDLRKGEAYAQAVSRLRVEIIRAQGEQAKVRNAGVPIADMKAAAREYVKLLQVEGRPRIVAEHDRFELLFSVEKFDARRPPHSIMAWIDPAPLLKRLNDEIDRLPKPALALSKENKAKRLAEIETEIATLEFSEEILIESALEQEGVEIARRPTAAAAAILGIVIKTKRKAAA